MLLKHRIVAAMMVITATLILTAPQAVAQVITYYRIVVEDKDPPGRLERYRQFHESLLTNLNVPDLGNKDIGCKPKPVTGTTLPNGAGCEILSDPTYGKNVESLTFALERIKAEKKLTAFMKAFHTVQTGEFKHDTFLMMIDGATPRSGACPFPPPHPTCGPRPICIQTSECDKPVGQKCQLCTP